jgi:hypothetical protein
MACAKRQSACVHTGETLGIVATAHAYIRAVTWENAIHTLCTKEKVELSTRHATMANKEAQRLPEIYRAVMQAQDGETLGTQTGEPVPR